MKMPATKKGVTSSFERHLSVIADKVIRVRAASSRAGSGTSE